jgi:hypothetical protein
MRIITLDHFLLSIEIRSTPKLYLTIRGGMYMRYIYLTFSSFTDPSQGNAVCCTVVLRIFEFRRPCLVNIVRAIRIKGRIWLRVYCDIPVPARSTPIT